MALILAVDDSVTMRQMVTFTLTNAGHQVLEAESGDEALKLAKSNKFDLVITDVNMPGMNRSRRGNEGARQGCGGHRLDREAFQPRSAPFRAEKSPQLSLNRGLKWRE
jgi:hypothetical protein